ncbi:MAG TPA: ABC transporter permease subunit, partial [Gemmataceae bacterium]|nr:ABC transporter permease subunit [Gemmataceae bacterium]
MSDQAPDKVDVGHPGHRVPAHLLQRMGRLVRKEVSTILRDRRTIITLVLMPLLLYPLLTIAFRQFLLASSLQEAKEPDYRIGFRSKHEELSRAERAFIEQLLQGQAELARREQRSAAARESASRRAQESRPRAERQARPAPGFKQASAEDLEGALLANQIDLGVRVVEVPPREGTNFDRYYVCTLLYLEGSPRSHEAREHVERCLAAANNPSALRRLASRPVPRTFPVQLVDPVSEAVVETKPKETIPLSALVPLILILMTITGAVYPAIDLTAGERERGTLEILVAAPIPRLGLLFAKYLSVVTVAVLTAVVNLTTMTITLLVSGMGALVFPEGMRAVTVLQVFLLLLLFAAFFSAVLLAVTSFARSFKEAQAYLIPLMLVSLTPGMLSLMPGLKLEGPMRVVPLLNIVLLTRDIFAGEATAAGAALVVLSTLVYAAAAIALAARIFGAEAVLYNEQGSWSDLFRRPVRERSIATVSSALFCLALMFPSLFVFFGMLAHYGNIPPGWQLALKALASLVLFGGFPLVSAWLRRVRLGTAFRVERMGLRAWGAAVLFGLSLWPLADVVQNLLRDAGLATLNERWLGQSGAALPSWRGE